MNRLAGGRWPTARRSGSAVVETAIVLPVLLAMAMGMAEFGQCYYVKNAFESAARDAMRAATPSVAQPSDPATAATAALMQAGITFNPTWMTIFNCATGQYVTDCSQIPAGHAVTVTVQTTYDNVPSGYRPLFLMTGKGIGAKKLIVGTCTAIKE